MKNGPDVNMGRPHRHNIDGSCKLAHLTPMSKLSEGMQVVLDRTYSHFVCVFLKLNLWVGVVLTGPHSLSRLLVFEALSSWAWTLEFKTLR